MGDKERAAAHIIILANEGFDATAQFVMNFIPPLAFLHADEPYCGNKKAIEERFRNIVRELAILHTEQNERNILHSDLGQHVYEFFVHGDIDSDSNASSISDVLTNATALLEFYQLTTVLATKVAKGLAYEEQLEEAIEELYDQYNLLITALNLCRKRVKAAARIDCSVLEAKNNVDQILALKPRLAG